MSDAVRFHYEQLSLFDATSRTAAVSLFDGRKYGAAEPTNRSGDFTAEILVW